METTAWGDWMTEHLESGVSKTPHETIVEHIDEGALMIRSDGTVGYANESAEEMLGSPLSAFDDRSARTVFGALLAEDNEQEQLCAVVDGICAGGAAAGQTLELAIDRGATAGVGEFEIQPVADDSEAAAVVVLRDITRQYHREQKLEQSQHRLAVALDGSETGIWEWIPATNEIVWHESTERLFGVEPGTLDGSYEALRERVHDDDVSELEQVSRSALPDREPFEIEYRIQTPDGSYRWVASTGRFVDIPGLSPRYIGIITDIHDRKRRQEELEKERAFTESVINSLPDTFYAFDLDGNVLMLNDKPAEEIGEDPATLETWRIEDFVVESDREAVLQRFVDVVTNGKNVTVESALQTADGRELPYEFTGAPLRGPEGEIEGLVGVGRDISDRLAHRERLTGLHHTTEALIRADSLGKIGDVICTAAAEVLDLSDAMVVECDQDGGTVLAATERLHEVYEPGTKLGEEHFCTQVFETNEEYLLTTAQRREVTHGEAFADKTVLGIPLGTRGTICFASPDTDAFDVQQIGLARTLTTQASAAIERLEREQEYKRSERRYRTLAEHFPNGSVFLFDSELRYQIARGRGLGDTGHEARDFEGNTPTEVLGPEAGAEVEQLYERTLEGEATTAEIPYRGLIYRIYTVPLREDDGTVYAGLAMTQDVTKQKERERELERREDLMRQTELLADTGGWEYDPTAEQVRVTAGVREIFGLSPEYDPSFDEALRYYNREDGKRIEELIERCLDDDEAFSANVQVTTDDGRERWVRVTGERVTVDGQTKVRGAIKDITTQHRRESKLAKRQQILQKLHAITRELIQAQTVEALTTTVVDQASDVDGIGALELLKLDPEEGTLRATDEKSGSFLPAGTRISPGSNPLWEVYRSGKTERFDSIPNELDGMTAGEQTLIAAPVGDLGLLIALPEADEETASTVDSIELLAANVQSALERLQREAQLDDVSERVADQETRIHELEELTDSIQHIQQQIADSDGRDQLEAAVCTKLVATDRVDFAWIGRPQTADTDLQVTASAGDGGSYLDATAPTTAQQSTIPAQQAAKKREPVVYGNIASHIQTEDWAKEALSHGFKSVISIPLIYDDVLYGVLSAYSGTDEAFGGIYETLFTDIGSLIANSISISERRQMGVADRHVELEFEVSDTRYVPHALAARTGATLEFDTVVETTDESVQILLTVVDGDGETVRETADQLQDVQQADWFGDAAGQQLSLRIKRPFLASLVEKHSGQLTYSDSTPTGTAIRIRTPAGIQTRPLIESLTNQFTEIELRARREGQTAQSLEATSLETVLTDRQLEILRAAYFGGYFESPKAVSGADLADNFDISAPVVYDHLRMAQGSVLEQLFDSSDDN